MTSPQICVIPEKLRSYPSKPSEDRAMRAAERITGLRGVLVRRRRLLAMLGGESKLKTALAAGEWVRVCHGWYVPGAEWKRLQRRDRHLAVALATDAGARQTPLFSHGTAGLLLDLPILRFAADRVHVVQNGSAARSTAPVMRHSRVGAPDKIWVTNGLEHTSPVRTLIDVMRSTPFETGLAAVESALNCARTGRGGTDVWGSSPGLLREALYEELAGLQPCRGHARARRVLDFASDLSESPLETLGRLQLARLGFTVRQQVEVIGPNGERYRIDLELEEEHTFIEADGRQKYRDPGMRRGKTLEEFLLDEKIREDNVRGVTDHRFIRVMWEHVQTPQDLAHRLRSFNVPFPPHSPDPWRIELA